MTKDLLAYPQFSMLNETQCEAIHRAALEILRRTGVRVYHPAAQKLLQDAGATITDETLVRIPPALVEWALKQAPSTVTLCERGTGKPAVHLAGSEVSFGPGSDCLRYLDPKTGERRLFQTADVVACIRLVDALPELGFCMSMGIPADLGLASPYSRQYALMLEHTCKPVVFVCEDRTDCEAIVSMAAAAAGGMDELRLNPTLLLYSEPSTPLRHSETATAKLLYMAEVGLPLLHSPAPMMGGTAPMTLAGAVALGNAEVLSSLVMHQLQRPGAPFVYGVQVHHMDMRTMISVYGAPEYQLGRAMSAEMARYYGLPIWGNAGMSDSPLPDEQAAADATFAVLVALLSGTHLAHDVGYLEAGLTTSPEMIVLTTEIINMLRPFAAGVPATDAEALALEVIHQVGPGGDYLSHEHTLRHFREFWQPALFTRQRLDDWLRRGGKRTGDRLRERTVALMASHQPAPLPDRVREEIVYIEGQR
jgi:trimethylamine---corrinoid protein Co-methyltransferase